jgi:hypothetical protein
LPRTRFAKAVNPSFETPERASIREALWFDIESAETSDDQSLSDSRVASLDHTAILLGATHLLLGISCFLRHPDLLEVSILSNPVIPLGLILALDALAALA